MSLRFKVNKKELEFILQEGEGYKIEFKEGLNEIDKEMASFANSDGGRIFLGISDNKKIKGVKVDNKLKSQIQDIANNCDPAVEIKLEEFKTILIINVKEGKDKPYKCKDGFFIRVGPNSQKMRRDKIVEMAVSEGKFKFDEIINKDFDYKKDFDAEKLNHFLVESNLTRNMATEDILFNLGVASKDDNKINFNNAGVLFFSKNPCNIIRQAYVTCIRFKGNNNVDIIDRIDLRDDITSNIENAIKFVRRSTKLSYEIKDIKRKEIPEYPVEAVREAITNSVMHRDYFEKGANVFVNIYDDRLEVYNPGGLPKGMNKEDLGKKGVRRNPLIADLLHRAGYVEKAGTGIGRMEEAMKKFGLPKPKIEVTGFFTIKFYPLKLGAGKDTIRDTIKDTIRDTIISKNEKKIIENISLNPKITSDELAKIIGINVRNTKKNIDNLKKKGLLKRIGSRKSGYWEIVKGGKR